MLRWVVAYIIGNEIVAIIMLQSGASSPPNFKDLDSIHIKENKPFNAQVDTPYVSVCYKPP